MRIAENNKMRTATQQKVKSDAWRREHVPYFVAYHRQSGRMAVYNRHYRIISEDASPELRAFVVQLDKYLKHEPFSFSYDWQRPAWLSDGDKVFLQYLYSDADLFDYEHLASIPLR